MKEANGENGHPSEAATGTSPAATHVTAPSVDPHLNSRYFKVVYRGAVAVRSNPAEPAPEVGQVSTHVKRKYTHQRQQWSSSLWHVYLLLSRGGEIATTGRLVGGRLEEHSSRGHRSNEVIRNRDIGRPIFSGI